MRTRMKDLGDRNLLSLLHVLAARECTSTAKLVACIAEVDRRRLYRGAGYASMYSYCLGKLGLSEDAAYKRIQAARAGQRFPAVLHALHDGRLHLTGAVLLAPFLTAGNVDELLAAATRKTKSQIEQVLARRFPCTEELPMIEAVIANPNTTPREGVPAGARAGWSSPSHELVPEPAAGTVGACASRSRELVPEPVAGTAGACASPSRELVPEPVAGTAGACPSPISGGTTPTPRARQLVPEPVDAGIRVSAPAASIARLAPIGAERYALHLSFGQETRDKLDYARALLGHSIPTGDLAAVVDRALELAIVQLEKQKFAATDQPRLPARAPANPRTIPAAVKRAVWERDGGRCTFVGDGGHRCEARTRLEWDHVDPVAFGGRATVEGVRLRCSSHNQLEAERAFGADFMERKREEARRTAAESRTAPDGQPPTRGRGCGAASP